jgi:hypothetical protein
MDTDEHLENQYWTCCSRQKNIMNFFIWLMNYGTQHSLLDFTACTVGKP